MDSQPDVRPKLVLHNGVWLLSGAVCRGCEYRLAVAGPWCPVCHGELAEARFGPGATVWASTILRVPVGGYPPPRGLAFVDLDEGPRLICDVADMLDTALEPGHRVMLSEPSGDGNPVVRPIP